MRNIQKQRNHRAPAQRHRNCLWTGLLLVLFVVIPCLSWARDAEELLAELNHLSPKEREKRVIEGAKQEGSLNWYGNIETTTMGKLNEAFQRRYSIIKAQYFRGSGVKLINRILMEARQNRFDVDAFFVPFELLPCAGEREADREVRFAGEKVSFY